MRKHTGVVGAVDDGAHGKGEGNPELSSRRTTTTCNTSAIETFHKNLQLKLLCF